MACSSHETEVKFYLTEPDLFLNRLNEAGASLKHACHQEINLLFDDVAGNLQATRQILRLRKDKQVILTYKGTGEVKTGVLSRREIEVVVSDFDVTRELLENLGYHPHLKYEKNRTAYNFLGCEVVVDEMPYGWFCEIEGASPQEIHKAAEKLGLRWDARITESYRSLFERCKQNLGLTFTDLTFTNFKKIKVTPQNLGVSASDG